MKDLKHYLGGAKESDLAYNPDSGVFTSKHFGQQVIQKHRLHDGSLHYSSLIGQDHVPNAHIILSHFRDDDEVHHAWHQMLDNDFQPVVHFDYDGGLDSAVMHVIHHKSGNIVADAVLGRDQTYKIRDSWAKEQGHRGGPLGTSSTEVFKTMITRLSYGLPAKASR